MRHNAGHSSVHRGSLKHLAFFKNFSCCGVGIFPMLGSIPCSKIGLRLLQRFYTFPNTERIFIPCLWIFLLPLGNSEPYFVQFDVIKIPACI